jgi:microcystin-dependent protein
LCNGAAVSRSTYSALFAVLGTAYGSGDGSTTFNVPDFRDRFPVGAGTTYSANSTGGSANATLVSHTHTATSTDAGHTHNIQVSNLSGASVDDRLAGSGADYGIANVNDSGTNVKSSTASITTTISTEGSSGTNANLPPYLGVYFIIKT